MPHCGAPGQADLCKHSSAGGSDVRAATGALARSHGWTDYQERLARVTAYIHDHLAVGPGLGPPACAGRPGLCAVLRHEEPYAILRAACQ
ncbi:hypothetical protein [Polaromonas sp.]|uniref:hypothetical protein n=1 Tax=Polaromonas sp. TaxID=1869339 RepID=UPI003564BCF4